MKQHRLYHSTMINNRKLPNILACALVLLLLHTAKAQSITGIIHDEKTTLPLEGAGITLFDADDSSLITGTTTQKDGAFVIDKLNNGNYYLIIKFIGYQSKKIIDLS